MADTQTIEIPIIVNSTEYLHYRIIEGANRVVLTTETQAVFASDVLFNKFAYLEIDGQHVPDSMYLAESGATVITPKHGYLRSLETGMHDLTIYSTDGSASTHFTLVSPAPVPKTGDRTALFLLLTLMTASAALGAVLLFRKRGKHQ